MICIGGIWSKVKHTFVDPSVPDENAEQHKEQFTALVREIKNAFRPDGLLISLTVLPNVNSTGNYFSEPILYRHLED